MTRSLFPVAVVAAASLLLASRADAADIKLLEAFAHDDGSSRYVAVLRDNGIYWYAKGNWTKTSNKGLPDGDITHLAAYTIPRQGSRYVVAIGAKDLYWFNSKTGWSQVETKGLPSGYQVKLMRAFAGGDGKTRYVVVLTTGDVYWFTPGYPWEKSSAAGLP